MISLVASRVPEKWQRISLLLIEEIHHLRCLKPCKQWDIYDNWCRVSSINSSNSPKPVVFETIWRLVRDNIIWIASFLRGKCRLLQPLLKGLVDCFGRFLCCSTSTKKRKYWFWFLRKKLHVSAAIPDVRILIISFDPEIRHHEQIEQSENNSTKKTHSTYIFYMSTNI